MTDADNKLLNNFKTWETNKMKQLLKYIISDISTNYNITYSILEEKYINPLEKLISEDKIIKNDNVNHTIDDTKCNALTKNNTQCTRRQKRGKYCETHASNLKYGSIDKLTNEEEYFDIQTETGMKYYMDNKNNIYLPDNLIKSIGIMENNNVCLY